MSSLETARKIFILGIKGVGMAQLAIILHKMGKTVIGVDVPERFITDEELSAYPIEIIESFDIERLPSDIELAIYSAAHGGANNPVIQELNKRGVASISQADLIGELMTMFDKTIAVCGSHGKTTTSSLLSHALIQLGVEPSYLTGSSKFGEYPAGDFRGTNYFVLEADEYGVNPPQDKTPKFLKYHPTFTLCTNVDFDHPDIFENLTEVENAYESFFKQSEYVIVCSDSSEAVETVRKSGVQYESYGFDDNAAYRIINHESGRDGSRFDLIYGETVLEGISIPLYGDHNILNAAGVVTLLLRLGFMPDDIRSAVANFEGAKRRFEVMHDADGLTVVDDYAHHPAEIEGIIQAVTVRYGQKPIVVFQPHTYSRTQALLESFSTAFNGAKQTFILPIFASAREDVAQFSVTHEDVVKTARERGNEHIESCQGHEIASKLASYPLPEVVITMGAGDVYKLGSDIIKGYASKKG